MSDIERTTPYVYQPKGVQDEPYWRTKRIYAVSGVHPLARIEGLTRGEADVVQQALEAYRAAVAEEERRNV